MVLARRVHIYPISFYESATTPSRHGKLAFDYCELKCCELLLEGRTLSL